MSIPKQITFTADVDGDAIEIYSPNTHHRAPTSVLKSCLKPKPTKGLGNEKGSKSVEWGQDQSFIIERVVLEFKKSFPPVNYDEYVEFQGAMNELPWAEQPPCDPRYPSSKRPSGKKFYSPRSEPNVRERFAAYQAARAAQRPLQITQNVALISFQENPTISNPSADRTSLVVFKSKSPIKIPRIHITSADSDSDELEENYPPDSDRIEGDADDGDVSNESEYGDDSDIDWDDNNDSDDIGSDDVDDRELQPYLPDTDVQDLSSAESTTATSHSQTESPPPGAPPVTETVSLFSDAPTPAEFENSRSIFVKCPELARMHLHTLPLPSLSASPSLQDLALAQEPIEPLDRMDWKLDTSTSRLGSAFVEHFPSSSSELDNLSCVTQASATLVAPDIPKAQPLILYFNCTALVAPIVQSARDLLSVVATGLGAVLVTVGCMILLTALTADPCGGESGVTSYRTGDAYTREDSSGEVPSDMKLSLKVTEPQDGSLAWLDSFQNLGSDLDENLFSPLSAEFHGFSGVDSYDDEEDSFLDDSSEDVIRRLDPIVEEAAQEEELEDEGEVLLSAGLQGEAVGFVDLDMRSVFQGR